MALKKTRTMCTTCHARCGVYVYSDDENQIVKIEGDPENLKSKGVLCGSGMSQREIHNNTEGRLLHPMKRVDWDPSGERHPETRGKSEFERITWDEALDIIASECLRIKDEYGPEAIITGQGTGRTTNHWHCRINSSLGLEGWSLVPTHVCLMPHILPNAFTLGLFSSAAGDVKRSKTVVLWGQNPAMETAWMKDVFRNQAENDTKLIVIDVRFQDMSKHADVAIQPRPGTDGALALALIHEVIENEWYDREFIDKWTYGFDQLAERVKDWTPERAAEICWIDAADIREAARIIGTHGPVGMCIGLGPGCMHSNAIQNGRAIACLQGLLGWFDQVGGIPVPLSFSVMLDDKITLWDEKDPGRADLFTFGGEEHPLYKSFGRSNDPHAVFNAIITGEPRPIKAYIAIANDPLLCYENTNLTYQAMTSPNLDFIAVKDFYFSPTAKLADLLLPSADWSERCTYDEELDGNFLFDFDQAVEAPGECKDDWWFFLQWGKRIDPDNWWWNDEKEMVLWRFKEFYGYDLTWEEFHEKPWRSTEPGGEAGEYVEKKYEKGLLRPDGSMGFSTPTGRIEFWCNSLAAFGYDPLPDYSEPLESPISTPELAKEYPLIAVTGIRVYSFFHSAWTNIPAQRKLYPDPFVMVHPDDAKTYGITDGEWVTVTSRVGHIISKALVTREIKKGCIGVPRPGWRDECPELGLPGYGWDKANGNILVPSTPAEPGYGATPMRSSLCKIEPGRGDL